MKTVFGLMVSSLAILLIATYTWMHIRREADSVELLSGSAVKQAREAAKSQSDADDSAAQGVTMVGPLASYMNRESGRMETVESIPYVPTASDHVGGSVVGTSNTVLQKTFGVAGTMQLPFVVPAHAYNAQLHGSFRSYLQGGRPESNASKADVEFLLMSDQQFKDMLNGRPSDAVFSAEAAHDQEVNANLPPTLDKPVTYHLVFRNNTPDVPKKLVQADFRLDF